MRAIGAGLVLFAAGAAAFASPRTDEGVRLFEARRFPEARAALEAAVQEDSRDTRALYYLGRTLMAQNEPEKAAAALEKSVALDPASAEKHLWLGRAWGSQAQSANFLKQASLAPKIRREFEKAVELDPGSADARFSLIEYYINAPGIMGGSLDKAREEAAAIARLDPLRGYRARARILEYEKNWDAAGAEYDRAARQFPDKLEPAVWGSNLWAGQKNWSRAFAPIEAFLSRNPASLSATYQIGRLAALSGENLDRGAEALTRYLASDPRPEDPPLAAAQWRLGQILEKKGDRLGAKRAYEEALKLDASHKEAKEGLKRVS